MANSNEVKSLHELSTKAEKRNAKLLASLFTGDRKISYFGKLATLTARQRQAFVDALLRARRLWSPNSSERIVSASVDAHYLSERGAGDLARETLKEAIHEALSNEFFELVLHLVSTSIHPASHKESMLLARQALEQIHELDDLITGIRNAAADRDDRQVSMGMYLATPLLHARPFSTRCMYLQLKARMMINIYLERYRDAIQPAMALLSAPVSTTEMLTTHFQIAQLHCILGDYDLADQRLTELWSIESRGADFDSVKIVEWLILKLSIGLDVGNREAGTRALNMLATHVDPYMVSRLVPPHRFTMAICLALQFAVENLCHGFIPLLLNIVNEYVPSESPNRVWCEAHELAYWFLIGNSEAAEKAIRRLRRRNEVRVVSLLIDLVKTFQAFEPNPERLNRTLEEYAGLPQFQRSRLKLRLIYSIKTRQEELPLGFYNVAASQ